MNGKKDKSADDFTALTHETDEQPIIQLFPRPPGILQKLAARGRVPDRRLI